MIADAATGMKDLPSRDAPPLAEPHMNPISTIGRINTSRGIERFDITLAPAPAFYNPSLAIK